MTGYPYENLPRPDLLLCQITLTLLVKALLDHKEDVLKQKEIEEINIIDGSIDTFSHLI